MTNQVCSRCGSYLITDSQNYLVNDIKEELKSESNTCGKCSKEELELKIELIKAGQIDNILKDPKWNKKKLLENLDYYLENGLMVFTEYFHLKKGYCCKNNCRHCPYN
ncbi:DUF5522 domain-containing protein [Mangrovivirga cuniculi]|uniref:Uncharacterized protein n=1 Tax=Mangrovivirga cuniculi TaxID=2715131 RepID=A0A4D7JFY1_9BACT|nr:DUF5522 domain-containing protein [Mangrovivirga cuniculi]QCK15089.1 hypothetical protein DCC35_10180 [Mangrovivirga cuniculi]